MALAANRFYLGHGTATLKLEAGTAAARETAGPFRRPGSRFTQQERALSTPPAGGAPPAGASARDATVLLSALQPPAPRRSTVVRQELLDRLLDDMPAKLVLVAAPAGWGKTSLLRDWYASAEAPRTAWLSIDHGDNDPGQFWAGVIAALRTVYPGVGGEALQVLNAPGDKTAESVLPPLINDLARVPEGLTLVIDDFHLITNEAILECFGYLVDHLPWTLGLIVATRSDPGLLPLAEPFQRRRDRATPQASAGGLPLSSRRAPGRSWRHLPDRVPRLGHDRCCRGRLAGRAHPSRRQRPTRGRPAAELHRGGPRCDRRPANRAVRRSGKRQLTLAASTGGNPCQEIMSPAAGRTAHSPTAGAWPGSAQAPCLPLSSRLPTMFVWAFIWLGGLAPRGAGWVWERAHARREKRYGTDLQPGPDRRHPGRRELGRAADSGALSAFVYRNGPSGS
jgi:hypothetical protein